MKHTRRITVHILE